MTSAIVLPDAEGRPQLIQGVMLDITERKAAEEQIAYLAYHDNLTGLPNRAMFDELLELALARARRADLGVAVLSRRPGRLQARERLARARGRRRA